MLARAVFSHRRISKERLGIVLGWSYPLREVVKAAGLVADTVTSHVMRHTAIRKLVQAAIDLPTVQRISGRNMRTMPAMALRSTHVHSRHIDQALQAIGRTIAIRPANDDANTITPGLSEPYS
jgi:hypothetical protein